MVKNTCRYFSFILKTQTWMNEWINKQNEHELGEFSLRDFIFAKEVRLGTYAPQSLPPGAIVAQKAMVKKIKTHEWINTHKHEWIK